jgi:hypothetical protein
VTIETARAAVEAALKKCQTAVTNSKWEAAVEEIKIALAYLDLVLWEEEQKEKQ